MSWGDPDTPALQAGRTQLDALMPRATMPSLSLSSSGVALVSTLRAHCALARCLETDKRISAMVAGCYASLAPSNFTHDNQSANRKHWPRRRNCKSRYSQFPVTTVTSEQVHVPGQWLSKVQFNIPTWHAIVAKHVEDGVLVKVQKHASEHVKRPKRRLDTHAKAASACQKEQRKDD